MANIVIGIADMRVAKAPDTLTTLGLGSCVGIVLYDPYNKIGGMAHIMLPVCKESEPKNRAKFADTAVEELLKRMAAAGANRNKLSAKLAGGAHMFVSTVNNDVMKVGQRNIEMCHQLLSMKSIPIISEDTGGNIGRTIEFCCETGRLAIRTAWPRSEKII